MAEAVPADELLEARADFLREPLDRRRVVRICEADDEALHTHVPELLEPSGDLVGGADDRVRWVHTMVVRADVVQHLARVLGIIAHADPLAAPGLHLFRIAADLLAVLVEDLELARHRLGWSERVPHVGVPRGRAERLLLP